MSNYMKGVAKLLGLELREEFRIEKCQGLFRITEDGLQRLLDSSSSWTLAEPSILRELLRGEETVVKFPWKPDDGEQYYVPHVDPTAIVLRGILMGDIRIVKLPWKPREGEKYYVPRISVLPEDRHYYYYWGNSCFDIECYKMGIVCKTKEEAIALTEKMLEAINEQ